MVASGVQPPVKHKKLRRIIGLLETESDDIVAVEEPLKILFEHGPEHRRRETVFATTMRTPGHDSELVVGMMLSEGYISDISQLISVRPCRSELDAAFNNVYRAVIDPAHIGRVEIESRTSIISSACGVCGARSIASMKERGALPLSSNRNFVDADLLRHAYQKMTDEQMVYRHTGGAHAAGLFDLHGNLLLIREDVGRHNALDKVIGALSARSTRRDEHFLVMSSRASFELVQKAVMARLPVLASIGAPSSLAIETAEEFGLSLCGFLRDDRINVYTHGDRIITDQQRSMSSSAQ